MKLMIYMQFIPFSPETFFFLLRVGGGGVERFVIIPVYVGLKAGLLQSFRVFYQIYVPSFIFSFNFYIIKNTPIKIKNTSSC